MGGWQVGNFPVARGRLARVERRLPRPHAQLLAARHRHRARRRRRAQSGIGSFARRLAGSEHVFSLERGPLASRQLHHRARRLHARRPRLVRREAQPGQRRAQPRRHRQQPVVQPRRRGSDPTMPRCSTARRKAMRNLLGTLLLSRRHPDAHRRRRVRPHASAATTTPTATTASSPGCRGSASAGRTSCSQVVAAADPAAPGEPGAAAGAVRAVRRDASRARPRWTGTTSRACRWSSRTGTPRRAHAAVPGGVDARVRGVQPHPAHRARPRGGRDGHPARARGRRRLHAAVGLGRRRLRGPRGRTSSRAARSRWRARPSSCSAHTADPWPKSSSPRSSCR